LNHRIPGIRGPFRGPVALLLLRALTLRGAGLL
jgi:hypothetical protein